MERGENNREDDGSKEARITAKMMVAREARITVKMMVARRQG